MSSKKGSQKNEKPQKNGQNKRTEKPQKSEKPQKPQKSEKIQKNEKPQKAEKPSKPEEAPKAPEDIVFKYLSFQKITCDVVEAVMRKLMTDLPEEKKEAIRKVVAQYPSSESSQEEEALIAAMENQKKMLPDKIKSKLNKVLKDYGLIARTNPKFLPKNLALFYETFAEELDDDFGGYNESILDHAIKKSRFGVPSNEHLRQALYASVSEIFQEDAKEQMPEVPKADPSIEQHTSFEEEEDEPIEEEEPKEQKGESA